MSTFILNSLRETYSTLLHQAFQFKKQLYTTKRALKTLPVLIQEKQYEMFVKVPITQQAEIDRIQLQKQILTNQIQLEQYQVQHQSISLEQCQISSYKKQNKELDNFVVRYSFQHRQLQASFNRVKAQFSHRLYQQALQWNTYTPQQLEALQKSLQEKQVKIQQQNKNTVKTLLGIKLQVSEYQNQQKGFQHILEQTNTSLLQKKSLIKAKYQKKNDSQTYIDNMTQKLRQKESLTRSLSDQTLKAKINAFQTSRSFVKYKISLKKNQGFLCLFQTNQGYSLEIQYGNFHRQWDIAALQSVSLHNQHPTTILLSAGGESFEFCSQQAQSIVTDIRTRYSAIFLDLENQFSDIIRFFSSMSL